MLDAMNTYGADSFVGRLSSIVQGSCDTTFYVVALYYGSVGIRNTRYTVQCALVSGSGRGDSGDSDGLPVLLTFYTINRFEMNLFKIY